MSKATKEEMKIEAIRRMKDFHIAPDVVSDFENDNLINCSMGAVGACYWIDEETREIVDHFEKQNGGLVYHVIKNKAAYPITITGADGETDTIPTPAFEYVNLLYVSKNKEEWRLDREDMKAGDVVAYVYNATDPECSELGHIGIQISPAAGVYRIW